MTQLIRKRSEIYDHFHSSRACQKEMFLDENSDRYTAYYTSMYLIQDTAEALLSHIELGFTKSPMAAYLEFWGAMQALIVQQDSISELFSAIQQNPLPKREPTSAWSTIREKRNILAGHPAAQGRNEKRRSFMGRMFGGYDRIQYESWNAATQKIEHPTFNLRKLISEYEVEAVVVLSDTLCSMQSTWPITPHQ
jgi:hypothetical protein